MQVFMTGATGFVGAEILGRLLDDGHRVRCLVRSGPEKRPGPFGQSVEVIHGDVLEPSEWIDGLYGCDAVVHLVGIIREFSSRGVTFERFHVKATTNVVEAAQVHGVRRFLHMSALGVRPNATTAYHQTKYRAERLVRESGLDWTVFRPSTIFGRGDRFVNLLADMMKKAPFMPVFGDGLYKLQPVAVENVAEGFTRALAIPQSVGRAYEAGGPEPLTYLHILHAIAAALHRTLRPVHVPMGLMKAMASVFESIPLFPITHDQLVMLQEGSTCDEKPFFEELGIAPVSFEEGIARYLS